MTRHRAGSGDVRHHRSMWRLQLVGVMAFAMLLGLPASSPGGAPVLSSRSMSTRPTASDAASPLTPVYPFNEPGQPIVLYEGPVGGPATNDAPGVVELP